MYLKTQRVSSFLYCSSLFLSFFFFLSLFLSHRSDTSHRSASYPPLCLASLPAPSLLRDSSGCRSLLYDRGRELLKGAGHGGSQHTIALFADYNSRRYVMERHVAPLLLLLLLLFLLLPRGLQHICLIVLVLHSLTCGGSGGDCGCGCGGGGRG